MQNAGHTSGQARLRRGDRVDGDYESTILGNDLCWVVPLNITSSSVPEVDRFPERIIAFQTRECKLELNASAICVPG
jgi:hypothetical protein